MDTDSPFIAATFLRLSKSVSFLSAELADVHQMLVDGGVVSRTAAEEVHNENERQKGLLMVAEKSASDARSDLTDLQEQVTA